MPRNRHSSEVQSPRLGVRWEFGISRFDCLVSVLCIIIVKRRLTYFHEVKLFYRGQASLGNFCEFISKHSLFKFICVLFIIYKCFEMPKC